MKVFIALSLYIVSVAMVFVIIRAESIGLLLRIIISILLAVDPIILFIKIMQFVESSAGPKQI